MIDALTRALLLKYQPDSPLLITEPQEPLQAPVEVEVTKAAYVLPLDTRIALARLQGIPEYVIKLMEATRKDTE
jgi:hypothetical protein